MKETVQPKASDLSLGWAWRPEKAVRAALSRGVTKLRKQGGADSTDVTLKEKEMATKSASRSSKKTAPSHKKTPIRKVSSGVLIPLKKICQDLDLDPKASRVKLRRLTRNGDLDIKEIGEGRWEFTPPQAKEVRARLKG